MAVMKQFGDIVATLAHDGKPLAGDGAEFRAARFEPAVDRGLVSYGAVESEKSCHESAYDA
jgi:hypothetical protein